MGRSALTLTDGKGNVRNVDYPEAAIWDLLSRGYSFTQVATMMAHIASVDVERANAMIRDALEEWAASGFIESL